MKHKLIKLISLIIIATFVWQGHFTYSNGGQVEGSKWGQVAIGNCKRYKGGLRPRAVEERGLPEKRSNNIEKVTINVSTAGGLGGLREMLKKRYVAPDFADWVISLIGAQHNVAYYVRNRGNILRVTQKAKDDIGRLFAMSKKHNGEIPAFGIVVNGILLGFYIAPEDTIKYFGSPEGIKRYNNDFAQRIIEIDERIGPDVRLPQLMANYQANGYPLVLSSMDMCAFGYAYATNFIGIFDVLSKVSTLQVEYVHIHTHPTGSVEREYVRKAMEGLISMEVSGIKDFVRWVAENEERLNFINPAPEDLINISNFSSQRILGRPSWFCIVGESTISFYNVTDNTTFQEWLYMTYIYRIPPDFQVVISNFPRYVELVHQHLGEIIIGPIPAAKPEPSQRRLKELASTQI